MNIKYDRGFIQRWHDSALYELEKLYEEKTLAANERSYEDVSELNALIYRKKEEVYHLKFALENFCA